MAFMTMMKSVDERKLYSRHNFPAPQTRKPWNSPEAIKFNLNLSNFDGISHLHHSLNIISS